MRKSPIFLHRRLADSSACRRFPAYWSWIILVIRSLNSAARGSVNPSFLSTNTRGASVIFFNMSGELRYPFPDLIFSHSLPDSRSIAGDVYGNPAYSKTRMPRPDPFRIAPPKLVRLDQKIMYPVLLIINTQHLGKQECGMSTSVRWSNT